MSSTRSSPGLRFIAWLFFDSINAKSVVYPLSVPDYSVYVGNLDWTAALKRKFNFEADQSTLKFYAPSPPLDVDDVEVNWLKDHPEISQVANLCQPAQLIDDIIEESWDTNRVHLIITAGKLGEDASQTSTGWGGPLSNLPVTMMHAHFRRARRPIPPSSIPPKGYIQLQRNSDTAIYDGYYRRHALLDTRALPIQIYHPVFQQFLDRVNDPTFKPDESTIVAVSQLMAATMEIPTSESKAFSALCPLLAKILDRDVGQLPQTVTRIPGGFVYKQIGECYVPLVCVGYAHALGERGSDPSFQAAYSLREFLVLDQSKPILEKCCCPCFILSGSGAHLSILGTAFPYYFALQRLTDAEWVEEAIPYRDARIYRLARVFCAFRLAVAALDEYYDQVLNDQSIPRLVPDEPHPRFFPYPTGFMEYTPDNTERNWIDFEYIDVPRLDPSNVTFIVKVKSSDRKLVVKFVQRYGVEPHELLATEGMAPRLLYCGLLDGKTDARDGESRARGSTGAGGLYVGPIRMVVVEYIEGTTLDKARNAPEDIKRKIEKIVKTLHDHQFVFGDLRTPNIMITGSKVYFIDFDWSGKVGEARYPLNLSVRVRWPKIPQYLELKPILVEHDLFMLSELSDPIRRAIAPPEHPQ